MIKNILFDIDDTLFPTTEFSSLARKNALNAMIGMGLDACYDDLNHRLNAIIHTKGSNYQKHFDVLCRELHMRNPARYVAAAIAAYHDTKTAIQPFPTVPLTLLKLRQSRHRLYVATNGNPTKQWDKLIRLRIGLYFEDVFVSEEVGSEKGPAFYRKVLKAIGAKPAECVMVGDREDVDIWPAKEIGMHTVRMLAGRHIAIPTRADASIRDISELPAVLHHL